MMLLRGLDYPPQFPALVEIWYELNPSDPTMSSDSYYVNDLSDSGEFSITFGV